MKASRLTGDVRMLHEQLSDCLEQWESFMPKPQHSDLIEVWKNDMKQHLSQVNDDQDELVDSITSGLIEAYASWTDVETNVFQEAVDHDKTFALMQRPQTAQRTTDWYKEFQTRVTASEIYKVFGTPRERGLLVMQKAGKIEMPPRSNTLVVLREKLGPLDWGICFEPVVKQILESEWSAMIHECGRFVHPTDTRLAASPDGLLIQVKAKPQMAGHLLEIKCPKTRKIGLKIPMEYYYQMQIQLEVTGVRACEYVEARIELCEAGSKPAKPDKGWCGIVAVVGCFSEDIGGWKPCKYIYGPVGDLNWKPDLGLNEQTMEMNTWVCPAFHHETVLRDEAWFQGLVPKIEGFWADLEKAKQGLFTIPESSRKRKEVVCEIVDSDHETESPKQAEPQY